MPVLGDGGGEPLDPADAHVLLLVDEVGTIVVAGSVPTKAGETPWTIQHWTVFAKMRHEAERLGWRVGRFKDIIT